MHQQHAQTASVAPLCCRVARAASRCLLLTDFKLSSGKLSRYDSTVTFIQCGRAGTCIFGGGVIKLSEGEPCALLQYEVLAEVLAGGGRGRGGGGEVNVRLWIVLASSCSCCCCCCSSCCCCCSSCSCCCFCCCVIDNEITPVPPSLSLCTDTNADVSDEI